jgi:hypothetical protein
MRSVFLLSVLLCLVSFTAPAQPAIEWTVYPSYLGGTTSTTTLEQPIAYYLTFTGLTPNTAYSQMHMGFNHVSAPTTTRGSKWLPGSGWISPSTFGAWKTSDGSGVIRAWVLLRTPSSFSQVDSSRIRIRITHAGVDTTTFDSPFDIRNLRYDTTAQGTGAVVYGYMDTTTQNNAGKFMLAFREASDTRPMACWYIFPNANVIATADSQIYTTRMDATLRRAGYFQLLLPANTPIGKLEVRDTNNVVLRSKTSTLWMSGAPGTQTDLGTLDPVVMSVQKQTEDVPTGFALHQNYPNPFNPSTSISFSVPERSVVRMSVYDMLGREIALLVNESLDAGSYSTTWEPSGLSTGTYLVRLQAGAFVQTAKMMLVK